MSEPEKAPSRVGGFEVGKQLGRGGMGAVYRARQVALDRWVALKILPAELQKEPSFVERFRAEARAAAKLDHPNLVRVLEAGEADGHYFFAMELVEGESCSQRLRTLGQFSERDTVGIGMCVAAALGYAWQEAKLIHRDVKPDNIIIRARDGEVKLADLGLAKSVTEVSAGSSLTSPGMVVGTLHYISPEQAKGETRIDCRADIYSLGATLFHLLTGKPPFYGDNGVGLLVKHITTPFPDLRREREDISDGFCAVLDRMVAKNPSERYASWSLLLEDLNAVLHGHPPPSLDRPAWASSTAIPAQKVSAKAPAKVRVQSSFAAPLLAWGAVVATLLGGAIWFSNSRSHSPAAGANGSGSGVVEQVPVIPAPILAAPTDAEVAAMTAELNRGGAVSLFDGHSWIGWSRGGRHWGATADGILVGHSGDFLAQGQLGRDLPVDNFELSWQMRAFGAATAGVDFRSMKGHTYFVQFKPGDKVFLKRYEGEEVALGGPTQLKKADWHQFHLVARGPTLSLECDGSPTFDVDKSPALGRQLTLWVINGRAEFKDLTLRFMPPAPVAH